MYHHSVYSGLTVSVSIDAARVQLWLGGIGRGVGSSIESRQRLEHAEQTVGGRELQVFLRDIANETGLIASLETNKEQGTKTTLKHAW